MQMQMMSDVKVHTIIIAHFCPLIPGNVQKTASLGTTGDYRNNTLINSVYHGFRVMKRLGQLDDAGMKKLFDGIVFIDFEMAMIHTNKELLILYWVLVIVITLMYKYKLFFIV
jgi:hypothetical protein